MVLSRDTRSQFPWRKVVFEPFSFEGASNSRVVSMDLHKKVSCTFFGGNRQKQFGPFFFFSSDVRLPLPRLRTLFWRTAQKEAAVA